ncbi:MAG: hypothetical protein ACJ72Z_12585 [Pyrinomonadaceae bacterium]
MKRRNVNRVNSSRETVSRSSFQWRLLFLTIICASIVAAGFFFAARQHFSTMEFGLKNSKLRKQVEDLEAERRRLILAKEVSLSPVEVTRNAQRIGLREHVLTPPTAMEIKDVQLAERQSVAPTLASLTVEDRSETKVANRTETKNLVKPGVQRTETKALVKPIVQQTAAKPISPDVRPRIAEADKRIAEASSKRDSKFK